MPSISKAKNDQTVGTGLVASASSRCSLETYWIRNSGNGAPIIWALTNTPGDFDAT